MKSVTPRKAALTLLAAAAVALECLPWGVVMYFAQQAADGSISRTARTTSYFSALPFGYGNWGPMLTAVLSCALLAAALTRLFTGAGRRAVRVLALLAFLLSLTPALLGLDTVSPVGAAISAALAAAAVLAWREKEILPA